MHSTSAILSKSQRVLNAGLLAPVYFKHAVDAMGQNAVQMTIAALLTSGLCRVVNGVAKEIQHPCFTPISQVRSFGAMPRQSAHAYRCMPGCINHASTDRPLTQLCAQYTQAAGRRVAYHTFAHVLDLDISFHLERRTGALSRVRQAGGPAAASGDQQVSALSTFQASLDVQTPSVMQVLERGTRSIAVMFRAIVFTFIPTAIELVSRCMVAANDVLRSRALLGQVSCQ